MMNRYFRLRSGAIFLALMVAFSFSLPAFAQTTTQDQETIQLQAGAANALFEVLDHAAAREFGAMYDQLHPAVREVVPRNVAVALFADVYSRALPSETLVTNIEIAPWTWPVNGETYENAAEITVIIPVIDESGAKTLIEDTWYLVLEDGTWYWFLGTSQEFLDSINEQYADAVLEPDTGAGSLLPIPREQFIQAIVNDLDAFYRDVLSYTDFRVRIAPGSWWWRPVIKRCRPADRQRRVSMASTARLIRPSISRNRFSSIWSTPVAILQPRS